MADTSITREERYLEYLTGDRKGNVPKPVTRRERYLYELCLKGIGGEISPEEIKNAVNEYLEKNPVKPGATTEQAQQIEQNKTDIASLKTETSSLKEDISNKITKFYASSQGETHLADSDNGKIQDMIIYGKSSQDGVPTPESPVEIKSVVNPTVKVCGKNLLNATLQTTTQNGVTCTNNGDGTYTLNGTASDTTLFLIVQEGTNISNGTYKVTGCPSGGSSEKYYIRCGSESVAAWNDNGDGCTAIISNGRMVYRIVVVAGVTVNNLLFKPMLTTDLTATYDDYEPYHEQTVTLPYTLNAIPVSSGGNVTIDGQQYIADYVDVERGKLVRMVGEFDTKVLTVFGISETDGVYRGYFSDSMLRNFVAGNSFRTKLFDGESTPNATRQYSVYMDKNNKGQWLNFICDSTYRETADLKSFIQNTGTVYGIFETSEEIDLTPEEIAAFKALATYYPTTNISVNSEQLDGYTVFNYPIPFEDEWIKTKKDVDSLKTRLNDIVGYDNAAAHNAIYRGKNLGTQFTAEMSANIKNGTFKDLYCGDYLVINGTTYRFMDLNYLFKTGDTSLEINHILVVPDAPMYNHVMNDTNTTEGGYVGSKMYTSGLDQALAKIKADFGESHIVTYRNLLVNTVSNGVPSNWAWYSRQIDLMNEEMVYGTRAWSQASQNGYDTGTNKSQLAAFQHNHSLISSCRSWYWLRAVHSSTHFCYVGSDGNASHYGASNADGVRPCFLIS